MGPQSAVDRTFLYISSGGRAAGGPPKPPPRRPKRLPRDPKDVPRGTQDPQRGSQDTPKTLPKLPRLAKSFPELPRAQIDQNGLLKPCVLRCPTSTFERPYDTFFFFKTSSLWRFEHFAKIKTQKDYVFLTLALLKPCVLRCPASTFERPYETFFCKSSSIWCFEYFGTNFPHLLSTGICDSVVRWRGGRREGNGHQNIKT